MKRILPFLLMLFLLVSQKQVHAKTDNPPANLVADLTTIATVSQVYGSPSPAFSYTTITGFNLNHGETLTATAPTGYEISGDGGNTFGHTYVFHANNFNGGVAQILYIQLISTDHVGSYAGNITVVCSVNTSLNLSIVQPASVVTPAPLIVTGSTIAPKIYDGTPIPGTFSIGTLSGMVFSETMSVTGVANNYPDANVANGKASLINYTLIAGTGLLTDYTLTDETINGNITARPISVTADSKSKSYGASDPALTYTLTSGTLVNPGDLTGALARDAGESVNTYAITQGTLAASSNYNLTFIPGVLTINQANITVTADSKSKSYGASDPALTYTVTSGTLANAGDLTGALTRAAGEDVNTYAITQGTLAATSNYNLTFVPGVLTINQANITVTADAKSKSYGNSDPVFTYTVTSGTLVNVGDLTGTLNRLAGETVNIYAITQGTLAATSNYNLTFVPGVFTISTRSITVTADPQTKTYGDVDPALTYHFTPALIGGDAFSGALTRNTGEGVGTHTITQGTLTLSANYTLNYTSDNLTITSKAITVTADTKTKTYGDADPAFTFVATGLVTGDVLTGSLARAAGENVGTYAITQGTVNNTNNPNYSITYVGDNLTINRKSATVTADAKSKIYGSSDPALTYVATGLLGGDVLTGSLTRAAGEHVGTYAINQGTVDNANYTITYVGNNLSITKKGITVAADPKSKSYGSSDPAFTYVATGLVGGDVLTGSLTRDPGETVGSYAITQGSLDNTDYTITFTSANLTIGTKTITVTADPQTKTFGAIDPTLTYNFSPALEVGDSFSGFLDRVGGENVGTYAITQGSLSLNPNYSINFVSNNLIISRKNITVFANPQNKTYGIGDPLFTYSTSVIVSLNGALSRVPGENVGTYTITQGTVDNANNPNYNIFYVVNNLTINRKLITVSADVKTKVYGSSDPALTYFASGLEGTDVLYGALVRDPGEHVGQYLINQGTIDNTNNPNYSINYLLQYLQITKKDITVDADPKSKTYGDVDPVLTYTVTGLITGDALTGSLLRNGGEAVGSYQIVRGSVGFLENDYNVHFTPSNLSIVRKTINVTADPKSKTYGTADPALTYTSSPALVGGDNFIGSITRAAGETVGTYSITQGTLSLSSNYTLVYTPDNLTITRKNITVTADPKTKVYGDVDPALTYVVTGSLVGGDVITGSLSRAAGENAGNHAITQGTVNNTNNPNYNITFTPDNLAITKKPITVTADPQTKVQGAVDPVFTYVVTGGLFGGDVLTGALTRAAGETPATYAITQGTLDNSNYNITYVGDNLTITASGGGGGGVPGGGGGGLESKSLGDGVGNRMFNRAVNSLQGPIDYSKLPAISTGGMQNRTTGVGTALTLAELLPQQIKGTNYKVFNSTPTDLTQLTNAKDVLSIDYTSNNQAKAVAFATKTMGEVYDHTKAVCDRLKGSELLSIQNVLVNNVNMVRYDLKNPAGQTEYAMSFSVGAKNGRYTYTIQSNWLNNDYIPDEMMFNVQLWAESPALIMNMANDIISRLKAGQPVTTVVNGNGIPKTYITKGKRSSDNIELNISNSTSSTNGYFEVIQKSNEQSTGLTTKQVPFTIAANATVNAINVPASDNYESTINMYINGVLQDQVFMTDGNWAANVNTATGTVKSFKVSNDPSRVINDKSDFLLFRNVQVEANVPDFASVYKLLRGGGAPQDLTGYKTFQFTASGTGVEGLNITLIKNGVANWADQYSIVIPLSATPQDYKVSLDDFVSTATKDKINPNDITMVIFGLGVANGRMTTVSADISNASFSKTDVAYLNSLKSTELSVYPNPVTGGTFTASFKAPTVNNLTLQLTDANSGRVVMTKPVTSQVGINNVTVNFDRQPGISTYILTLEGTSIKYTPKKVMMNK